jgi:hypothetical protein
MASEQKNIRTGSTALSLLNDVITREVFRFDLIDLRLVCSDDEDFANAIEPSATAASLAKFTIAEAIFAPPVTSIVACFCFVRVSTRGSAQFCIRKARIVNGANRDGQAGRCELVQQGRVLPPEIGRPLACPVLHSSTRRARRGGWRPGERRSRRR